MKIEIDFDKKTIRVLTGVNIFELLTFLQTLPGWEEFTLESNSIPIKDNPFVIPDFPFKRTDTGYPPYSPPYRISNYEFPGEHRSTYDIDNSGEFEREKFERKLRSVLKIET